MKARLIELVESKHTRSDMPDFRPGDTIRVMVKITERSRNEERTRVQAFEGDVIRRSGSGINEIVTVRRVTYGVSVERTFPIHAPIIDSIEIVRMGHVRRAKLYYLRERSGRAGRIPEAKEGRKNARLAAQEAAVAEAEAETEAQVAAEAAAEPEVELEETETVAEPADDEESAEEVVSEEQVEEETSAAEQTSDESVAEAETVDDTPDEAEAAEEEAETTKDE